MEVDSQNKDILGILSISDFIHDFEGQSLIDNINKILKKSTPSYLTKEILKK